MTLGPSRRAVAEQAANVAKTATEKWVPVEGKPHLEREVHSGRMRYMPPDPAKALYPWPFPSNPS